MFSRLFGIENSSDQKEEREKERNQSYLVLLQPQLKKEILSVFFLDVVCRSF